MFWFIYCSHHLLYFLSEEHCDIYIDTPSDCPFDMVGSCCNTMSHQLSFFNCVMKGWCCTWHKMSWQIIILMNKICLHKVFTMELVHVGKTSACYLHFGLLKSSIFDVWESCKQGEDKNSRYGVCKVPSWKQWVG